MTRAPRRLRPPPLLAALLLIASACATRGTIAELGRPEFSSSVDGELTLIEPRNPGMFHAYPEGAGQGDYRCQIRMEEPPRRTGETISFVERATPTGDRKLKRFEIVAWPLAARDVIRFKEAGHPPGDPEPLRRVSVDKPIPGSEAFGLIVGFPAAKLAGFDHIAVSSLVQFEDGWITIVDSAVLAPADVAPVSSK